MSNQFKANVMSLKLANQSSDAFNKLKWLIVILLLTAAIVANYYYGQVAWTIRLIAWLLGFPLIVFIASQTREGKVVLEYILEARVELRKITWPTRQETAQTTF